MMKIFHKSPLSSNDLWLPLAPQVEINFPAAPLQHPYAGANIPHGGGAPHNWKSAFSLTEIDCDLMNFLLHLSEAWKHTSSSALVALSRSWSTQPPRAWANIEDLV